MYTIYNEECLSGMDRLEDNSIDLVLCDPPYGTTDNKWDSVLPLDAMWKQINRVLKPLGRCVLFANQPFTSALVMSNRASLSHFLYWHKNAVTNFANANVMPLRCVEDILVFNSAARRDNTGMFEGLRKYFLDELAASGLRRSDIDKALGSFMSSHYFTNGAQFAIPSADAYAKLQAATGRFARPYKEIQEEWGAECNSDSCKPLRLWFLDCLQRSGKTAEEVCEETGLPSVSPYFTESFRFTLPKRDVFKKLAAAVPQLREREYEELAKERDAARTSPTYNPQGVIKAKPRLKTRTTHTENYRMMGSQHNTGEYTNYPTNLLKFSIVTNEERVHPTQKPVALMEYLVRTYSNEGDTVLDFTMGSGSTGVGALKAGRRFIGYEMDEKYFNAARKRLEETLRQPTLF